MTAQLTQPRKFLLAAQHHDVMADLLADCSEPAAVDSAVVIFATVKSDIDLVGTRT